MHTTFFFFFFFFWNASTRIRTLDHVSCGREAENRAKGNRPLSHQRDMQDGLHMILSRRLQSRSYHFTSILKLKPQLLRPHYPDLQTLYEKWKQNRTKQNVSALEERNAILSQDTDVREFDTERILCHICGRWLHIDSSNHTETPRQWTSHRTACQKVLAFPHSSSDQPPIQCANPQIIHCPCSYIFFFSSVL